MIERVLVLVKPDGVVRGLTGKIISMIEDSGLKIIGLKMVQPSAEFAGKHYIADEKWFQSVGAKTKKSYKERGIELQEEEIEIGKRIRNYLLEYLSKGPVAAIAVEGNDAIFVTRKLAGSTEPKTADPGSIRGKYSNDSYEFADSQHRSVRNIVHVSDSKETAEREISLWFNDSELIKYSLSDEVAQYSP
ncbi:MAG: nucleoside-diphosphate kinase [Candidatus Micrarchaeia archaeon]